MAGCGTSVSAPTTEGQGRVCHICPEEIVRFLKAMRPRDWNLLDSYMLTGSKNAGCRCDPDRVPNFWKCEHVWNSAKDPAICHEWQFRSFLARSTNLSLVETCMIAARNLRCLL
jgi:hypothetical protein